MSGKSRLQNPATSKFWVSREIASWMPEGSISRCYGKLSESDNSGRVTHVSHICLLGILKSPSIANTAHSQSFSSLFITITCRPTLLLFLILPFHFLLFLRATSISPSLDKVKLGCTGGVPEDISPGSIQRWLQGCRWESPLIAGPGCHLWIACKKGSFGWVTCISTDQNSTCFIWGKYYPIDFALKCYFSMQACSTSDLDEESVDHDDNDSMCFSFTSPLNIF
jgi:hypothetical protein